MAELILRLLELRMLSTLSVQQIEALQVGQVPLSGASDGEPPPITQ